MSSFIDAVKAAYIPLLMKYPHKATVELVEIALTEALAAARPVYQHACIGLGREKTWADVDFNWYEGAQENMRRVMFTAPPADERDARIAALEETAAHWMAKAHDLNNDLIRQTERADSAWKNTQAIDKSRMATEVQLAASQAAQAALANKGSLLREPISGPGQLPPGCYCKPGQCAAPVIMGRQMGCRDPAKRDAVIDQSAAGSEAA